MIDGDTTMTDSSDQVAERTLRKIWRRIVPFIFVLYIVAYLDRANVAFAKLTMTADLRFSEAVFGFGAGLFFLGYFLLEIPGCLIVERWSARRWITRILISWGACTVLIGFVNTPVQFYLARFLLGVAEASFFPGIVVHLSHWFPERSRARALGGFITAVPVALALGAPVSGAILTVNWFGLSGWRWVFILEGLPAILLGMVTLFYLTDRPRQATWLKPEELSWLSAELESERTRKLKDRQITIWAALKQRDVLLLAFALFFSNIGAVGYLLWLPTIIHEISGLPAHFASALSAFPFAAGIVSIVLASRSSDRRGERRLHACVPMFLAGCLFALTSLPGQPFVVVLLWLCLTSAAKYAWPPSFWVLPTAALGESAAAAAIGLINSIGNLGGFIGPTVVGSILASNQPFSVAIVFLSACFFIGSALTFAVRDQTGQAKTREAAA